MLIGWLKLVANHASNFNTESLPILYQLKSSYSSLDLHLDPLTAEKIRDVFEGLVRLIQTENYDSTLPVKASEALSLVSRIEWISPAGDIKIQFSDREKQTIATLFQKNVSGEFVEKSTISQENIFVEKLTEITQETVVLGQLSKKQKAAIFHKIATKNIIVSPTCQTLTITT